MQNVAAGDFVMLNGLKAEARFFEHAPKRLFMAEQKSPAEKKEGMPMNLETLKAEHPDLVQAIRAEALREGAETERARIQAIEALALPGFDDIVNAAKYDTGESAEAVAVAIIKAQKARGEKAAQNLIEDAKALEGLGTVGNTGMAGGNEDAERAAVIAAGARGFARSKK